MGDLYLAAFHTSFYVFFYFWYPVSTSKFGKSNINSGMISVMNFFYNKLRKWMTWWNKSKLCLVPTICKDPKYLNKALERSHYSLPTVENILPYFSHAKVFSVLKAKNGFWHVELGKERFMLTTFNTLFCRFRWFEYIN